jgi:protein phosphatase
MRVVVGVATDIGRVRERNEDSYLVEPPLYAVADGMGGARGGAVASSLALDTVEELLRGGKASLPEMIRSANRAVFERSISDRQVSGMGTTLTATTVDEQGAHLGHVGDSRAYLLRAGALRQLTDDHTLVNRMVKAGEITPQEAGTHPHRNVLTRSIGTEPEVVVDENDVPLIDGDRLLLCSDGLTGWSPSPRSKRSSKPHRPTGISGPSDQSRQPSRRHRQHHGRDPRHPRGRRGCQRRAAGTRDGGLAECRP